MDPLRFRFRTIEPTADAPTYRHQSGSCDDKRLQLGSRHWDLGDLAAVERDDSRLLLILNASDAPPQTCTISVSRIDPAELKRHLDVQRSRIRAERNRLRLATGERSAPFRQALCRSCEATIDLTGFAETPQAFCPYCQTISTVQPGVSPAANETEFRLCEVCGMFSRPQSFTSFYFYYLVVHSGFHARRTMRCPACMRAAAWKMLAANLLFVVGVLPSCVQLTRAYRSSRGNGEFAGLDPANLRARRGRLDKAIEGYRQILQRVPCAAGIHYNLGLALYTQRDLPHAAAVLELALADCANYEPAYRLLLRCYEQMSQPDQLQTLSHRWPGLSG